MKYLLILFLFGLIGCNKHETDDKKEYYINTELVKLLPNNGNKVSAKILIRKTIDLRNKIMKTNDKNKISEELIKLVKVRMCLLNLFLASKENGGDTGQQRFFTSELPASNFLKLDNGMFYPNEKDSKEKLELHILQKYPEYSELNNVVVLQTSTSNEKCSNLVLE
jgi:hypothetical protein